MPNPRLTGLGCGLFCGVSMVVLAGLDRLLFGASPALYGVLFLLVSALTAVWVRRGDLASATVVVPIAFAAGLPLIAEGEGGLGEHLMALVTALAMQAGWLYGGTLVAGVIVTVRKVRLMARRAVEREWERERERRSERGREQEREREGKRNRNRVGVQGQVRKPGAQARPLHDSHPGGPRPRGPRPSRRTAPRSS